MKTLSPYILVLAVTLVASLGLMSCLKGGTISSIEVTPANVHMAIGEMQKFIATAKFSDGTSLNWTTAVSWTSSDPAVAIVSNVTGSFGIVTAGAVGTAIITATDLTNNLSGSATLFVNNPVTIIVTPADQVISLATTTQLQFKAAAIFTPGTELDLTTVVFWSSSDTGVATISNTSGTNGLAHLLAPGKIFITATDLITNKTGTTTLTVQ